MNLQSLGITEYFLYMLINKMNTVELMKRKINLIVVMFFYAIIVIFSMLLVGCAYTNPHSIRDIETKTSPDGKYEIIFQNVGLPDFPFGDSHAKIILKEGNKIITKQKFDVANDGVALVPGNWEVSWYQDCVQVVIKGSEQHNVLYTFTYDGEMDYEILEELSISYSILDSDETETIPEPLSPDEQRILDGLLKVYEFVVGETGACESDITYTAKCTPKMVVSEDSYILYDRVSVNGKCALYVLYENEGDAESVSDPQIVDMYAYEYESGKVIRADRHSWSDAGTKEYQWATEE